jgi:HSP20 family protein
VDVSEEAKEYKLYASLPGVDKSRIDLSIDGDTIQLKVSDSKDGPELGGAVGKGAAKEPVGPKWLRTERVTSFVQRTLRMPEAADLSKLEAKMENGVLTVAVPKFPESHHQQRRVHIA